MDEAPKLPSTFSSINDTIEDVACGFVMHRYKGYKRKRRWGQLRVEMNSNSSRCIIRLFKHDLSNPNQDISKGKEPKLKFELEFTRNDFCGLEKGEHYNRYGMRRYLCVITKDTHLIIEDAVMTATGINHNVLGTWYQLISQIMQYVNRWKVVENNPKLAGKICYLHLSLENTSECHSLEDRTRENRSSLVLRTWKTQDLKEIKEQATVEEGKSLSDLSFFVPDNFGSTIHVKMMVEGSPNLRETIQKVKRMNGDNKKTTTICPDFDLNYSPNLVKIPKQSQPKSIRGILTKTINGPKGGRPDTLDMQRAKKQNRYSHGNLYVKLENDQNKTEEEKAKLPPYYNTQSPSKETEPDQRITCCHDDAPSTSRFSAPPCLHDSNPRIRVPPSLADHSPTRCFDPEFTPPYPPRPRSFNGLNSLASPDFPSPGLDENDLKKAPELATQTSFDSGFLTGDMSSMLSESDFASSRYMNLARPSSGADFSATGSLPRPMPGRNNAVYQNISRSGLTDQPPAIPARDEQTQAQPYVNMLNRQNIAVPLQQNRMERSQPPPRPPKLSSTPVVEGSGSQMVVESSDVECAPPVPERQLSGDDVTRSRQDLVADSIRQGTLPPLNMGEDQRAYENSIAFDISISEVLQGTHLNNVSGRWLDLPHSVFVTISLGLEKEGVTVGDWRAFAEKLGLTFKHIQQLSGLMRIHPTLRPLEVLLLHWNRTQAPLPLTRANLHELLVQIGRDDLARVLPLRDSYNKNKNNNDDSNDDKEQA